MGSVEDADGRGSITFSDTTRKEWEAIFVPSSSSHEIPTKHAQWLLYQHPFHQVKKRLPLLLEPAVGIAARIEAKDDSTQAPPHLSRLTQCHLEGTGIEACPRHQMDHGVRDPNCDCCKRALGAMYKHKIKGNRHLPVFTFDFSGPHPKCVNAAQYLLVCLWSLGDMRLVWAFGIENRQATTALPCLKASSEELRSLTGGSRPPILRLHSDKAKEFYLL